MDMLSDATDGMVDEALLVWARVRAAPSARELSEAALWSSVPTIFEENGRSERI
jgi:hypothetical protein